MQHIHDGELRQGRAHRNAASVAPRQPGERGQVFAHRHVTRGPIHIIALTAETRPRQMNNAITLPPAAPKICVPAMSATCCLPTISAIGVVRKKTAFIAEVEQHDDEACPARRESGMVRVGFRNFADDVGGSVPTRVGEHDPVKADREGRAQDQSAVTRDRQKRDRLRLTDVKPGDDDDEDERDFQKGGAILKAAAQPEIESNTSVVIATTARERKSGFKPGTDSGKISAERQSPRSRPARQTRPWPKSSPP